MEVLKMPDKIQATWEKYKDDVLATPKFLKRGKKILVKPTLPVKKSVDGRYGPREMYIVDTVENGLVYVSPMQLVSIAEAFDGKYDSPVTVEL